MVQGTNDPIAGISSMATRDILAELIENYVCRSGQQVLVESIGGVAAEKSVIDGGVFDFVVLADSAIERMVAAGRVVATTRITLARSGIALAVIAGAPHPHINDEAGVLQTVLAARSIGYSTGPSGAHLMRLFERWGIAEAIAPRIVLAPPGVPVGTMVANGDVDLGFQQLSELIHLPGIDVAGVLPSGIQAMTVFSAALCATSVKRAAVEAFFAYLSYTDADQAKLRHGMELAATR